MWIYRTLNESWCNRSPNVMKIGYRMSDMFLKYLHFLIGIHSFTEIANRFMFRDRKLYLHKFHPLSDFCNFIIERKILYVFNKYRGNM